MSGFGWWCCATGLPAMCHKAVWCPQLIAVHAMPATFVCSLRILFYFRAHLFDVQICQRCDIFTSKVGVFVSMFFDGLLMKSPAAFFSSHVIITPSHTLVMCEKLPRSIAFFCASTLYVFMARMYSKAKKFSFESVSLYFHIHAYFPEISNSTYFPNFLEPYFP